MAHEEGLHSIGSLAAAADLSAQQFRFVRVTAALAVNITTAATDFAIGVLQNKPTSGQPATVAVDGLTKVVAGAAFSAGDRLTSDANGRAIATVTAGNRYHAIAVEAATAANQIVSAVIVNGTI